MSGFAPSHEGIGQMLRADFMVAEMQSRADDAKDLAVSIAPVFEHGPHPGRYKASFYTRSSDRGGVHHDRAVGVLGNSAPEALAVEFGTRNNPRHATLRFAIGATNRF